MRALLIMIGLSWSLPLSAAAEVDARFAQLKEQAEPLSSLAGFVERFVGNCPPLAAGGAECERNVEQFRRGATGKKYHLIVVEDSTSVLSMGEMGSDGAFSLNLTPFFAASNSALTHGSPAKTDSNGNPILPFLRIPGTLPDGWSTGMMARQVGARTMRLQIVFTPLGVWSLPKKGGGPPVRGVRAKFDAVAVEVGRTGEHVGLWLAK